ncbi:hypothetical protein [Legionella cherrii]|uniref:Uncharacterized protein n=1 Tax=Legionella cherrii TaxID=28084 RepID=A0ABY6T4G8_9GAMM|nr:hypothetical protein [Legionella cherrii]VEB35246.1 Uncharacterised protein [Legionella cherrii]
MHEKIELEVDQTSSKVVINYHKHPEVGGTGHVSIEATHEGKKHVISVYPSQELSPFTPLVISSMYIFPTKAVNHSSPLLQTVLYMHLMTLLTRYKIWVQLLKR